MAAAIAIHTALASGSSSNNTAAAAISSHRFARHHRLRILGNSRAWASRDRSTRPVSTSRTSTVIPTTGVEIESTLNGIIEQLGREEEPQTGGGGGGSGNANNNNGRGGGGGGGGGGDDQNNWKEGPDPGDGDGHSSSSPTSSPFLFGLWESFLRGWRSRVRTDPQFPFKVLTEEVIGVGACVLGDMASRPNFGLNELDFVFSTVVVGSILNFTLMYMLAPTSAGADISRLPNVFASCPPGHMFEPGAYTALDRLGTLVYKGVLFAAAGFAAGLVGTAVSTLLLTARKRMDPQFELQNKPPPTLLNAATWAAHMGVSSNLRYQALNGMEHFAAGLMNPGVFKAAVFAVRAVNNVLGGTSFVMLARMTGSQRAEGKTEESRRVAETSL